MKLLLIGNFAPPYEEENLHNLSLLGRLEGDGDECTVINISANRSTDKRFINAGSFIDFTLKLFRHCPGKDIIHFSTKGYLRLGLLKLMTSILFGKIFRLKTFITIHSELFSIQGQMRSPVGGRQTLFTSFTLADKIICADKDTYNVASMYMRKSNFVMVPSSVHIPEGIKTEDNSVLKKIRNKEKVIVCTNVKYPSFLFEILNEIASGYPLPSDVCMVISLSDKSSAKIQHVLEETGKDLSDNLVFIDPDDLQTTLAAFARANIVIRPLSCDGTTFFEDFSVSVRKLQHANGDIYFPSGLIFVKEGETAEMCVCIINTMLCVESGPMPEFRAGDSYQKMRELYRQ